MNEEMDLATLLDESASAATDMLRVYEGTEDTEAIAVLKRMRVELRQWLREWERLQDRGQREREDAEPASEHTESIPF